MSHGFGPATAQLATRLSEDEVRVAIDDVLVDAWKGSRTNEPDAWAVYRTGSATALRLWGVYSVSGARRFPLVIRIDQTVDGSERVIRLIIEGDEGVYLFYPPRALRLWRANVDRIIDRIRERLDR